MDTTLKSLFDSGRKLLADTKAPKPPHQGKLKDKVTPASMAKPTESDPYRMFAKRTIHERPKKPELVDDIKRLIEMAEKDL